MDRACRLHPTFAKVVRCFCPSERLFVALCHMRENDYSQVVVRSDGALCLLTVEGIARWLEDKVGQDLISLDDVLIGDVLVHELQQDFLVMSADRTVRDAHEAFARAIDRKQPRLFAIIITASGSATEEPLGLVTPWDLLDDHGG